MKVFSLMSLLLLASLAILLTPVARAELSDEDLDELDDEDAIINDDSVHDEDPVKVQQTDETDEDLVMTGSPFARATVMFVQPETAELPAGRLVRMLVGFHNNGTQDFVIDTIDGSFRYPQDFSYHIQNFTVFPYNKVVEPTKEATFEYMFTPSETFSSRQFGLTINLRYHSQDGKAFVNAVFNETVSISEPDEGIDGETFFLYMFLAAIVVLCLVAAQQFFSVFTKKRRVTKPTYSNGAAKVSSGSGSDNDIDYEWIPKEHFQTSANKSPKVSPRQRRGNAAASGNSSNDE